jgi:glycine cleavage system T protein
MSSELKRTRLYQWHVEHGARLVPFAGWEMPVFYPSGPIEEHHLTRRSAGLFDIDHMGQITVSGPQAEAYLNHLLTWDMASLADNAAHYALMCYEHGGIVDDVFVYKLPEYWLVVVNADNLVKDFQWMQAHQAGYEVHLADISEATYMLALQGPQAIALLQSLTPTDLVAVPRFTAREAEVGGTPSLIGRTGYTGEDGVELFFPAAAALNLWQKILDSGAESGIEVGPIGLAARDSLRFEPGFALYGHEITAEVTPLEAGLAWACNFDTDFIGREALLVQKEQGLSRKLVSFELTERGVPRQGYPVTHASGPEIGMVVTGLYAPTVDKYCGNAFIDPAYASAGTELQIIIRDKAKRAVVVKRPFYRPAYRP